ncbi:MAG TPA: siderophore-interacting protein [Acidimicrobiales bacterium]|nr:siderophore-interacting protein [Acidimicrobiales bacterium]
MSERRPVSTRRPVPDEMFGGRLKGSYLLDLEVVGVDEVAPHVRLITMASPDLVGFEYTPGQDLLFEFRDGDLTLRRRYTIRRLDSAAGIADFEIEIHDGCGPATRWAAKAEVGEHLETIGPRGGISLRPTATSHLFVVDDSAMPAAFALLEALPAGTPATALLVTSHGVKLRPAPAGGPATSLVWLDQAEMLEMLSDLHPAAGTAAYLFGERHLIRTTEGLLIAGGLDRDVIASKAYWRRDQPNASHGEPSWN